MIILEVSYKNRIRRKEREDSGGNPDSKRYTEMKDSGKQADLDSLERSVKVDGCWGNINEHCILGKKYMSSGINQGKNWLGYWSREKGHLESRL